MARVSRFIEHIGFDYTPFPELERQITLADEKTALITSTDSVAKPKTITSIFAGAFKAARRLGNNTFTGYKCHIINICQGNTHHDDKSIEAGSISSSSYGAPMTSAEELEQQAKRNNLFAIFGLRLHDEPSTFPAYTAKKQPTIAIIEAQATAEPRTPDAPTVWAQAFDKSEIERIENNTMATIEYLVYLGVEIKTED